MVEVSRGSRGEVVLHVSGGSFDGAAAQRMAGTLQQLPPDASVVLDFTRVKQVQDHGLLTIASALADRAPSVAVRGIGRHQERLLKYFGVELARVARSADART